MATLKTIKENPPSSYLTKLAVVESGNNPNAKAKTSSASGAFQFLESTWKGLTNKYKLGYSLDDRFDPIKSKKVADLLTKENENALRPVLGREPNDGERYLGHFLGTQGSKQLLSTYLKNPNEKVGNVVSGGALKANKSIFLNKDGSQKTVGDIYNWSAKKMSIKPTYVNTAPQDKNQTQETITPTLNYFDIPKETTTFASVPDSAEKEETTEKIDKDVAEVEQKTKEYNFLEELQKEDYSHLQPQQIAQQQALPQVDFNQQYEQVSQFIDQPLAQQGGINFTKEYINSLKYKERLNKQGYDNPNEVIKSRLEKINSVNIVNQEGKPNIVTQLWNKVTDNPYSTQGSAYIPEINTIVMDNTTDNLKKTTRGVGYQGIKAHELGHTEIAGYDLSTKDKTELFNRLKTYKINNDFTIKDRDIIKEKGSKNEFSNVSHDLRPEENKSDLNSFRYLLKNQGIYDSGKEDFTKKHLEQIKSSFIKDRLLKNYSQEDLIWLMNNIAQNEKNTDKTIQVAQQGGKYSESELAFLSEIAIKDNSGYWNPSNHGKVVEIQGSDITMKNVDHDLIGIGIDKKGKKTEQKTMKAGKNYNFENAVKVIEIPFFKK